MVTVLCFGSYIVSLKTSQDLAFRQLRALQCEATTLDNLPSATAAVCSPMEDHPNIGQKCK